MKITQQEQPLSKSFASLSTLNSRRSQRLLLLSVILLFTFAFHIHNENRRQDQLFTTDTIEMEIAQIPNFIRPDPERKFFHQVKNFPHLDYRYGLLSERVTSTLRHDYLILLLKSFMGTCEAHNIQAWISHGTLIGWYWNKKLLPWDDDIDIQTTLQSLFQLQKLNNTIVDHRYLVEVNPNFIYREYQKRNVIDARYIDTWTGFFIDITALAPIRGSGTIIACKSPHYYLVDDIFPLEITVLEGVKVLRPNNVKHILEDEYGDQVFTAETHGKYKFNRTSWNWEIENKV